MPTGNFGEVGYEALQFDTTRAQICMGMRKLIRVAVVSMYRTWKGSYSQFSRPGAGESKITLVIFHC